LDYYRHLERTRRTLAPAEELLPVEPIGPASSAGALRIELANGRRIVVEGGFDASHLQRLIAALEG